MKHEDFIADMIGTSYDWKNVSGVNCWGLVAKFYNNLVDYTPENESNLTIADAFTVATSQGGFTQTISPKNGDMIIFKSKWITHCGLFFNKQILHSSPQTNGVVFEDFHTVAKRYQTHYFWTKL